MSILKKSSRALLIINPIAGKAKTEKKIEEIVYLLKKNIDVVTPLITSKKGDATEFVYEYAKNHDIVICCGGDGTLNEIISGLMKIEYSISIGFIPAGTTNDLANTLDISTDIRKSIRSIIDGRPLYHDVGVINDSHYFSYIASFGAFTKVSYDTPQWLKNKFGHFAYVLDGIKSFNEIRPYKIKIKTEDFEEEGEFVFGSISNSLYIGGVVKLNTSEVSLNDGKFEVLLIRNPHNPVELSGILYGISQKKYDRKYIIFLQTSEIYLSFQEETDWTCDGEHLRLGKEVYIKNSHNAIKLIL